MISNATKYFDILAINLNIPYNYFNSPTKLFSDLYLTVKFLGTSAKSYRVVNRNARYIKSEFFCESSRSGIFTTEGSTREEFMVVFQIDCQY